MKGGKGENPKNSGSSRPQSQSQSKSKSRSSRWDKDPSNDSKPSSSHPQEPVADGSRTAAAVGLPDSNPRSVERKEQGPTSQNPAPVDAGFANNPKAVQWMPQPLPQIGFGVFEKRPVTMGDGTIRTYYALPSDPSAPPQAFAGNSIHNPPFDNATFGPRDSNPGPYPGQEINNQYNRPENPLLREAELERFYGGNPMGPGAPAYGGASAAYDKFSGAAAEGSIPRDRDSQYFEGARDRDLFPGGSAREEHLYRNPGPGPTGGDREYMMQQMREMEADDYFRREQQERLGFHRFEEDALRQKMPGMSRSPRGASASGLPPRDRELLQEQWTSPSRTGPAGLPARGNLPYSNSPLTRKREEDHEYMRPLKYQKQNEGLEGRQPIERQHHDKDVQFGGKIVPLADCSDVFKQQVQKTFLRFSKILYENPEQCHKYEENGSGGELKCTVCGWQSKIFLDTHSLVMHAYNAENPALRLDHLGLYKALCVLMGWSHALPPDSAKSYQSLTSPEATANKEDLILWPPMVIIQNAYEGKTQDAFGNREMDKHLKELGCGGGKAKALFGKDHRYAGITLVKFSSSSSGLREAERLHKYFEVNKHGRKDWLQVQGAIANQENDDKNPDLVQIDEKTKLEKRVLYGYIAIAGDLEKLDFDARKKAVVRSRRDIDATADGVDGEA